MNLVLDFWIGWVPALLAAVISAMVLVARRCPLRYQLLVSLGWPALWLLLSWLAGWAMRASDPVPQWNEGESTRLSELAFVLVMNTFAAVFIAAAVMALQLTVRCVAVVKVYRNGVPLTLAVRAASR